jgi:hypothetical protein
VVSFTPLPLYPRGKSPQYPLDGRPAGPQSRSGRRGEDKILDPIGTRSPTPRLSSPQPVAIPTALSRQWTRKGKICPARNGYPILRSSNPQPSHYTNRTTNAPRYKHRQCYCYDQVSPSHPNEPVFTKLIINVMALWKTF